MQYIKYILCFFLVSSVIVLSGCGDAPSSTHTNGGAMIVVQDDQSDDDIPEIQPIVGDSISNQEQIELDNNDEEIDSMELKKAELLPEPRVAPDNMPEIFAIGYASAVVEWNDVTVFINPVGSQAQYTEFSSPDIVVITNPDTDHLSIDTMIGMLRRDTIVLAPNAVINAVPLMISNNVIDPFNPGDRQEALGILFTALAAYGTSPSGAELYPRTRGDIGFVMEVEGTRIYFSGATEATEEMMALEKIDTAFLAMTIGIQEAVSAVSTLNPRIVIPYQYRTIDGSSDVDAFEAALSESNPSIQVNRMDW